MSFLTVAFSISVGLVNSGGFLINTCTEVILLNRLTHSQFIRYALVGLITNALLFLGYLALTASGVGYKLAMTVLYIAGLLQSFILNRRWTFDHLGNISGSFIRYIATYCIGYLVNLAALVIFVDWLYWSHLNVQAVMILVVAVLQFWLQKLWVFS